jgi:hypothetical protein
MEYVLKDFFAPGDQITAIHVYTEGTNFGGTTKIGERELKNSTEMMMTNYAPASSSSFVWEPKTTGKSYEQLSDTINYTVQDLVVLGYYGNKGYRQDPLQISSTVQHLLQKSLYSLMLVKTTRKATTSSMNWLVMVDGSSYSNRAFEMVQRFYREKDRLAVINIRKTGEPENVDMTQRYEKQIAVYGMQGVYVALEDNNVIYKVALKFIKDFGPFNFVACGFVGRGQSK